MTYVCLVLTSLVFNAHLNIYCYYAAEYEINFNSNKIVSILFLLKSRVAESEVFGWSQIRIPKNTRRRIFLSDSDSASSIESFFCIALLSQES